MLKLIYAPDPILKKESVSIPQVDDHHKELIKQMYEIMYSANGVGLAAPQIGLNIRIFILDAGARDEEKKPITMINPKIISLHENKVPYEEGCLSFPEHFAEIDRPENIKIEYLDENNSKKSSSFKGFESRIIQHELDHLNGILFIDYLSKLKKNMIIKKLLKQKKTSQRIVV